MRKMTGDMEQESRERESAATGVAGGRGPTPRVAQPDEFFPLASEEMIRRGEIAEAAEFCRRGLVFYPENISGYAVLANAYLLLDEPTRAANVLRDGYRRTGAEGLQELATGIDNEAAEAEEKTAPSEPRTARRAVRMPSAEDDPQPAATESAIDEPVEEPADTPADTPADRLIDESPPLPAEPPTTRNDDDPQALSFISNDPHESSWAVTQEEEADLNPYVADRQTEAPTDRDLTDRLIVDDDESLFGAEVRPSNQDLFTGEQLPEEEVLFREDEEREQELEDAREAEAEAESRKEVDLIPPVEEIIVPTPEPEERLDTNREETDQLIPAPSRGGTARRADRGAGGDLADLIDEASDRMAEDEEPKSTGASGLSLHSGTQISDLRSRNLRLIPGLEYAPLRKDDPSLKIAPLVEKGKRSSTDTAGMPPLDDPRRSPPLSPDEPSGSGSEPAEREETEKGEMTPLEELARRLETARIPAVEEVEEPEEEAPGFEPSLVSDTFAGILVSQGAYSEAIKAYQMLARLKPDRRDDYEKKIAELHWKIDNVTDE